VSDERNPRIVRLPYNYGDILYHRARRERIPGMVVGFVVVPAIVKILVRWSNDMSQDEINQFELTEEFTPSFED